MSTKNTFPDWPARMMSRTQELGVREFCPNVPGLRKCMIEDDGSAWLNLVTLMVEPACRRQGVGTRAIDAVKQEARRLRKRGVRVVIMAIGPDAERVDVSELRQFYRRNGFTILSDQETAIWHA